MRLHVILQRDGRLKADWSCLAELGDAATVLVISDDSLAKLKDRSPFTRIVETNDFAVPSLTNLLDGLLAEHPGATLRLSTADETIVLTVARLRAHYGLPGQQPAEAIGFVDKLEMKRRVGAAGIPLPRHERFDFAA